MAFSRKLFWDRPGVVVADQDAAVIAVKSQGHAVATQQWAEQTEIAECRFRGKELRRQDFPGDIVLHAESAEPRTACFEPVVRIAIELHEFAGLRGTDTALAMNGRAALSRGAETLPAQEPAKGLATEREALALDQFLAEVVIVEAGVGATGQPHHGLAHGIGQATVAGAPTMGVRQSRLPVFAHTLLQALNLANAQAKGVRRFWHTPTLPSRIWK